MVTGAGLAILAVAGVGVASELGGSRNLVSAVDEALKRRHRKPESLCDRAVSAQSQDTGGLPPRRERAGALWGRHDAAARSNDPVWFVDQLGTKRKLKRYEHALAQVRKGLADHGLHLGARLGGGRYATVFELVERPDVVVKITGDPSEAVAWQQVLEAQEWGELKLSSLAHTFCVMKVKPKGIRNGRPLYVILQQRLTRLPKADRELIDDIRSIIGTTRNREQPWKARNLVLIKAQLSSAKYATRKAKVYMDTLEGLASYSMYPYDLHGSNVMADPKTKTGVWRISDLGITQTQVGEAEIPLMKDTP